MSANYEIKSNKKVTITFEGKSLTFKLGIKRAFTVLCSLLDYYPNYMDIHTLDDTLSDPNRALSSLRIEEGFVNFIDVRRNNSRNHEAKIDVPKLFSTFKVESESTLLLSSNYRINPTERLKAEIRRNFDNKCNITGIKLVTNITGQAFLKSSQIISYDHRIPLSKGGAGEIDNLDNWQLLSELANREKNNICNICINPSCCECALAYPEKYNIIIANRQNINNLKKNG